jgi:protein-S-isoprenylcysteine O-methyltransferase Ste14
MEKEALRKLRNRSYVSIGIIGLVLAAILFLSAGTFQYWQAWLYIVLFTLACFVATADRLKHDPQLVERRRKGGPRAESRGAQKWIQSFSTFGVLSLYLVAGFEQRWGSLQVPPLLSLVGDTLVLMGFYIFLATVRANTYAASTVQVEAAQKVIETGPYAWVRHPMYAGVAPLLLGSPLALNSYWGLVPAAATVGCMILRLFDEERMLQKELPGYVDYMKRVRYRWIPRIW